MSAVDPTLKVHKAKFEALISSLEDSDNPTLASLLRQCIVAIPEGPWALNWYKTKRHIPKAGAEPDSRGAVRAYCSPYTYVYLRGVGKPGDKFHVPPADSAETMDAEACRICTKKAARR